METDASGRPAPDEADDEWAAGELDLAASLRRIGYDAALAPTGPTLAGLHRAHVATIPFENADVMLGRGVAVDLPSIQHKLVRRGRGGYCFEHGQLLAAALERLGYGVDRLLARVSGERDARAHLLLRVRAGQECWVADTGFGTGLIEPLPFRDRVPHDQYGWSSRLTAGGGDPWWAPGPAGRVGAAGASGRGVGQDVRVRRPAPPPRRCGRGQPLHLDLSQLILRAA